MLAAARKAMPVHIPKLPARENPIVLNGAAMALLLTVAPWLPGLFASSGDLSYVLTCLGVPGAEGLSLPSLPYIPCVLAMGYLAATFEARLAPGATREDELTGYVGHLRRLATASVCLSATVRFCAALCASVSEARPDATPLYLCVWAVAGLALCLLVELLALAFISFWQGDGPRSFAHRRPILAWALRVAACLVVPSLVALAAALAYWLGTICLVLMILFPCSYVVVRW